MRDRWIIIVQDENTRRNRELKDRGDGGLVDEKEESLGGGCGLWITTISRGGGDGRLMMDWLGWVLAACATGENKKRMPF